MSHDFNRDNEVVEARKRFGDWIGFAWLECLSIGDRNKGIVPGTIEQIADRLAPISLQKYHKRAADTAKNFLRFATELGWIAVRTPTELQRNSGETDYIEILKFLKYHRTREPKQSRSETSETSEPIKIREEKIKTARKSALPTEFVISEAVRNWASEKGLPDPTAEFDAFRDYHLARRSMFIDWDAALRTWLRNAQRFANNGSKKQQTDGERLTARLAQTLRRGL